MATAVADTIRICVCAADDDLRTWVIDELSLISWIGRLQIEAVASLGDDVLRPHERDIVIVELDRLDARQHELLRARAWSTPTIAIGRIPDGATVDRVLGARVTSRELKQAVRELLMRKR